MNSPTTSPICPAQAAAVAPNCSTSPDRHDPAVERAKAVCSACPALNSCRRWLAGLPRYQRPCGVVAGRYVAPPKLRPVREPRPRAPTRDRAADLLRAYLAARGPVISTEVIADAAPAGFSCSTLYKARIDLNVRLQRVPGVGARHTWS